MPTVLANRDIGGAGHVPPGGIPEWLRRLLARRR